MKAILIVLLWLSPSVLLGQQDDEEHLIQLAAQRGLAELERELPGRPGQPARWSHLGMSTKQGETSSARRVASRLDVAWISPGNAYDCDHESGCQLRGPIRGGIEVLDLTVDGDSAWVEVIRWSYADFHGRGEVGLRVERLYFVRSGGSWILERTEPRLDLDAY